MVYTRKQLHAKEVFRLIIRLIKYGFVPAIAFFIVISSLLLGKGQATIPMLAAGAIFLLSIFLDHKIPFPQVVQFALLGIFHWYSQVNWCQVLYFVLLFLAIQKNARLQSVIAVSFFVWLEYTSIRLLYQPTTAYNLLVSVYDLATSLLVIICYRFILITERERIALRDQTKFLTTHDPLTGLLNYEGYVQSIHDLVKKQQKFILITIDFLDLKSFNMQSIQNGNDILVKMATTLQTLFPNSLVLSRYAGDRFAVAVPQSDQPIAEIEERLRIDKLGFQVTYSTSLFPQDGASTASALIAVSEDQLFQNKRKIWMLREERRFQEEKLKVVGELAAGMAHEIRNPLTTIKGFMQISKNNDNMVKPWFDLIMSEITRMTELTAEFLQFAKPHIGDMRPGSIQACIDRVLFLTESEAALRGHTICREGMNDAIHVVMDRDKIVQVLLNLIRNAFEAMQQPGTVHFRLKRTDDRCTIEVEDSGKGISVHELAQIFNPFYTTKEEGTGLGLSICKKIVQDHGGTLEVSTVVGEGSVFTVTLPTIKDEP